MSGGEACDGVRESLAGRSAGTSVMTQPQRPLLLPAAVAVRPSYGPSALARTDTRTR